MTPIPLYWVRFIGFRVRVSWVRVRVRVRVSTTFDVGLPSAKTHSPECELKGRSMIQT